MKEMAAAAFEELTTPTSRLKIDFHLGDLHSISGDPGLIMQVWLNLLSNAIKFSAFREKPTISIDSHLEDRFVVFSVQDNGAGFDMKYVDKLFGVFHRLHSENEFEGTGVGLAIVHRIITRHGGNVYASGTIDEGAVFTFTLPVLNV
jgi:light-regulated signal transduction histidine kinase (bacteriophytochrome)